MQGHADGVSSLHVISSHVTPSRGACVGDGGQALAYLARYLYRGVLSKADILGIDSADHVRFRYRDAKAGTLRIRRLPGVDLLRLLLVHVLPKGFRRSRN